jgi:prephenate dehydrogenase
VIGAHPLFGPSEKSISNQIFFLCPSRTRKWLRPLKTFLENLGARLVEIDPEQHDRIMACCQTLRHVMLAALGQTVAKLGYQPERHEDIMGGWFHQLMTMLRHQSLQPSELYADIALENPYSYETLSIFQASLSTLIDSIASQNRDLLIKAMDGAVQRSDSIANKTVRVRDWWWGLGGDSRHIEPG